MMNSNGCGSIQLRRDERLPSVRGASDLVAGDAIHRIEIVVQTVRRAATRAVVTDGVR